MIRSLFYLIQVAILILVVGWILGQSGRTQIHFGDYHLNGETSILAVMLLIGILLLLLVHRMWLAVLRLPQTWRRYRREIHLIKGHQALTRSVSALAAGDYKIAHFQATRAQKLLPDFPDVPTILVATTAEKQGRKIEANAALRQLMQTEARDLGVRGLVNAALNNDEWEQGLAIAHAALADQPRALMVARLVYDLECQMGDFNAATARQRTLIKRKALSSDQARHDRVMMLTALARQAIDQEQHRAALKYARAAFALDPSFAPAACELIDLYRGFGKTWAATKVLHHAFRAGPHPDLIDRHEQMAPQAKNLARRLRYHEKFLALAPGSVEAQLLLARVAIAEGMMGEAQAYLTMAEKLAPRRSVYRLLADFSKMQGRDEQASEYLTQGLSAQDDPVWTCKVTGRTFDRWEPIVLPEHLFGTVVWDIPRRVSTAQNTPRPDLLAFSG